MTARPEDDDDALSWAGGNADHTLVGSAATPARTPVAEPTPEPAVVRPEGWQVVTSDEENTAPSERTQMSSLALLAHGILAGIYLILTISWLRYVQLYGSEYSGVFTQILHVASYVLAVLAPAAWFGAVLWRTRGARSLRARLIWLLVGAVVLLPLPLLIVSAR